jgi:asparagine synthetase B (glutamine-hydrolysing)
LWLLSKNYHDLLVESVKRIVEKHHQDQIAILFSGGVDSLCILLSFFELGIKPAVLYTLQLYNYQSEDAKATIRIAEYFNIPHRVIMIREDYQGKLLSLVSAFIKKYNIKRKAKIETLVPFTMMFDAIRLPIWELEDKVNTFLVGFGADDLIGSSRNISIRSKRDPEYFNIQRQKILEWSMRVEMPILNDIAKTHTGKQNAIVLDPFYESPDLQKFMLTEFRRWAMLNRPYPKWIMKRAFLKYFQKYPFLWRVKQNMQTESKIREFFQESLGVKSVVKLYNSIYRNRETCLI